MRRRVASILLIVFGIIICFLQVCRLRSPQHNPYLFEQSDFQFFSGDNTIEHKIDNIELSRGIYLAEIEYYAQSPTILEVGDESHYASPYIRGNRITLPEDENQRSFRLYIDTNTVNAVMRMYEQGTQRRFFAYTIRVQYLPLMSSVYYSLCIMTPILVLVALLWIVPLFYNLRKREDQIVYFVLMVLFLVISVPLMADGYPNGDDTRIHILRIANLAEGLRGGTFPVRIQPGWFHDWGIPFGVYYPDLFLYFPAILFLLGVPLWRAFQFYRLFVNAIAVVLSFVCFRYISKDKQAGVLCSVIYVTSIRFLLNNHFRDAIGETLAMSFLPCIIAAFFALARDEQKKGMIGLVAGYSGLVQSHVITTRSALVFSTIVCLISFRVFLAKRNIAAIICAAFSVLLINAGTILPILQYLCMYTLRNPDETGWYRGSGTTMSEILFYSTRKQPYALGIVLIGAIVVCIFWTLTKDRRLVQDRSMIVCLLISVLSIWMSLKSFPYDLVLRIPLMDSIIGSAIQLKTRYLTIATPACCTLCALMLKAIRPEGQSGFAEKRKMLYYLIIAVSLLQFHIVMKDYLESAEWIYAVDLSGCEVRQERLYVFNDVDMDTTIDRSLHYSEEVKIDNPSRSQFHFQMDVQNNSGEESYIDFPIWNYYGYQGKAQPTGGALSVVTGENRRVRVLIPSEFKGTIDVSFREPWIWRIAEGISLVSFLIFVYYAWKVLLVQNKDPGYQEI